MARGWESKAVEAQQAEAGGARSPSGAKLSPQAAVAARQRESLRLCRQRVLQQLATSGNPRHRQMLESALAELDRQLEPLGASD